jgi:predicted RNA binding protein YcfA (HicA-like mRNA interferase family)
MPRFPVVSGRYTVRALQKAGFTIIDQEGSHIKLRTKKQDRTYTVIVPLHSELARKTLSSILRQAGLSLEEFRQLV